VDLRLDGKSLEFDKVVLAAPPDQVLRLLADPTGAERRRFGAWKARHVHTLVHDDTAPYERRGIDVATEFDVFDLPGGRGGYNSYLNMLCGTTDGRQYGLAFGMDDEIAPERILHRQEHHTPAYSVEAYRWRHEVTETNGELHTYHVGAWLGDGLHEGAVTSALAVSRLLGGDEIP
ncbi:MAG: NAD(P)/FAD-dependent oxidoreductase, partial [Planctomycetota bacterium]